jgi:choline dehydrogenase
LLLEAGGDDRPLKNPAQFWSNLMIHVPVGFAKTLKDPKVNWLIETEPDPSSGGRKHVWPRGKVLGGSSSINAMLYVRGQPRDYDDWQTAGCAGWGWTDVLPYFRRAEDQERGSNEFHGRGGPLHVADVSEQHPVSKAALQACVQAGLPELADYNGDQQEGVSWFQLTIKRGLRQSTAVAYLHPVMVRNNLSVKCRAHARRVLFEGRRAIGVEYEQGGQVATALANAEVILAAGSVASPQLLELSGVGPGALLQQHGIAVVADVPGVGENMQDHFMHGMQYRLKAGTISVNELTHWPRIVGETLKYLLLRKGLLTFSVAHLVAFGKSRPDVERPDVQFHLLPGTMDIDKLNETQSMIMETKPGLTIAPCQVRPESRGSIHIKSADPKVPPAIRPNYLADPIDQQVAVDSIKFGRRIASQAALAPYMDHERFPGQKVQTDEQLLTYARLAGSTLYHPVGTCMMGVSAGAVVDPDLRVKGVERLRVVDASVMPRICSGNTNAATIMIAEKGADLILGKPLT